MQAALRERREACQELQKRFDEAQERHEAAKTELGDQKQAHSKSDADVKRYEERRSNVEEELRKEEKKVCAIARRKVQTSKLRLPTTKRRRTLETRKCAS